MSAVAMLGLLGIAGCVNEDGGGGGDTASPAVFVSIDSTDPVAPTGSKELRGRTECDGCPPTQVGFGYCPAIQCPVVSSMSIAWKNRTTEASGSAAHAYGSSCSCLFSYCFSSCSHVWWATIPISIGENACEVTASYASGASGSASLTITRVPPAPAGLAAGAGKEQVTLDWTGVPDATSYNLYWSTSRNPTKTTGTKIAGVSSPYTHSGLSNDVTYYYLVTAVNGGYESFDSSVVWATPGWQTQTLAGTAPSAQSKEASIATDSSGAVHIHYSYDEHVDYTSRQYNYYLSNATGSWGSPSLVDMPAWVDAAIALDSSDTVHISYIDFPGTTHAVYGSGAWTFELVDANGTCGSDLALDSANHAHLADYGTGGQLRYATNASGAWAPPQVVDTSADLGCSGPGRLSLAVDPAGKAHIVYAGAYPGYGLRYATNQGGSWSLATVDSVYVTSLSGAVDSDGKLHIAYADNEGRLKYADNASSAWAVALIESEGSPDYPSLAVDSTGKAHVAYFYRRYGELRYATSRSGAWQVAIIDQNAGAPTALALDSQGKAHISYFGASLKYATNK